MQQRRMSGVMRMYEKLKTLKDKLQKMKTNRANRQIGQTFHFSPFSRKQKQVLTWWCKESPVHDMDGVIADGAIRSGKTISMSLSFVMWAMSTFTGQNFAMCGKTIGSFRRNVSVLVETDAPIKRIFHHGSQGRQPSDHPEKRKRKLLLHIRRQG